jgi:hypothetical protein
MTENQPNEFEQEIESDVNVDNSHVPEVKPELDASLSILELDSLEAPLNESTNENEAQSEVEASSGNSTESKEFEPQNELNENSEVLVQREDEIIANELKASEEKLLELQKQQDELNNQLESLDQEIEDYLGVLEDLTQWIDERKRSFAWKLMEATRVRKSYLENDELKIRESIRSRIELDDKFAPKTRKWVLKNILGNWAITLIAVLITLYIRRNRDQILAGLSESSSNSIIDFLINLLRSFVQNVNVPQYLFVIFCISTIYFLGTLFGYSRKISRHSREIDEEAFKVRQLMHALDKVRESRERIDSLYPQIPQILEVMSMALHRPFQIDHRYYEFKSIYPETSDIPESLEFAAPTEESIDRVFETLVLKTLNEIQQVGWRNEMLSLTLQQLGESVGIGVSNSAIQEIENDQRRLGKRHLLLNLSEESKTRPLTAIGDNLVSKYAEIVQEKVLPTSQPEVKSLRPDPLESLDLSDSLGVGVDVQISEWEVKLTEAAGKSSPWSTINFSNEGQSHGKHLEPIESIFIASKQAILGVPDSVSAFAEVDPGTRPFEVSIRADLSSWCKPGDLAIFEGLVIDDVKSLASTQETESNLEQDPEVIY